MPLGKGRGLIEEWVCDSGAEGGGVLPGERAGTLLGGGL